MEKENALKKIIKSKSKTKKKIAIYQYTNKIVTEGTKIEVY